MITPDDIRTYCPGLPQQAPTEDENQKIVVDENGDIIEAPTPFLSSCIDYVEKKIIEKYLGIGFYKYIKDYKSNIDSDTSQTREANLDLLLDGGDYTYSGISYENPGVIQVFSRFVYAKYVLDSGAELIQSGLVEPKGEKSNKAGYARRKKMYNEIHEVAVIQHNKLRDFIMRTDHTEYELYRYGVPRSKPLITIIR